jgi:hypothetical protein
MAETCKWVNQAGTRCGQPEGHIERGQGGHGNGLLTSPRDEWHDPTVEPPPPPPIVASHPTLSKGEPIAFTDGEPSHFLVADWTLREGDQQCLWSGANGRCVLRQGHFPKVGHQEKLQ